MDDDAAARNRFDSFKLGMGPPPSAPGGARKHAHSRSHSRNLSFSFPALKATTPHDSLPALSPSPSPTSPNLAVSSKRNSHHRRRSSVSTRHESAEMMGVALPDLPPSASEDNINLGEKDSIRRRALWALEGKPDVSFSKVEIPDISTADMDKFIVDLSAKSAAPSFGMGTKRDSFKLLAVSSSAKDQLHTLLEEEEEEEDPADLAEKENVHPVTKATPSRPRPNLRPLSLTPENLHITAPQTLPSPTPSPGPRSGLRALALTASATTDDTTPTATVKQARRASLVISPPPTSRPVLNLALDQLENACEDDSKPTRRSSISYKRSSHGSVTTNAAGLPTPEMTPTFGRRYSNASVDSSLSLGPNTRSTDDDLFPIPPTQSRPLSASEQHFLFKSHNALLARITDLERALSLRRRESGGAFSSTGGGSSRPMSLASSRSSISDHVPGSDADAPAGPSDEMLHLIADLKAERDELKRDADGWRTRVANMETQIGVLGKRVENERRESWVARSRAGLLEVEKGVLAKKVAQLEQMQADREETHAHEAASWTAERDELVKREQDALNRVRELEDELARVRDELDAATSVKSVPDPLATPTPHTSIHGLGFASGDSESSATDIELESDDSDRFAFKVHEERALFESGSEHSGDEDTFCDDDEDNGLAGYEDEDENDTDMSLQSSSSFGSGSEDEGAPHSPTTPRPSQVFTPPRLGPAPAHARRATLSKTWRFPFGSARAPMTYQKPPVDDDEDDKFFGCLDDRDDDGEREVPSSPSAYSYERSKDRFASAFKSAPDNDNASFFLPGLGCPAAEEPEEIVQDRSLAVVAEEDEDELNENNDDEEDDNDENTFGGDMGGIRIIFTPPQEEEPVEEPPQIVITSPAKRTSPPPVLPALDFSFGDEEESEDDTMQGIPFSFARLLEETEKENLQVSSPPASPPAVSSVPTAVASILAPASPPPTSAVLVTPPSSLPRAAPAISQRPTSPSRIPRPSSPVSVIPRPTTSRGLPSSTDTPIRLPLRSMTHPMSPPPPALTAAPCTPAAKRAGAAVSFIPTPVSSPVPMKTAPRTPTSTFIRQPVRKPLMATLAGAQKTCGSNGNRQANDMALNTASDTDTIPDARHGSATTSFSSSSSFSSSLCFEYPVVSSLSRSSSSACSPSTQPLYHSPRQAPARTAVSSFYNFFDLGGSSSDEAASSAHTASTEYSHLHSTSGSSTGSATSQETVTAAFSLVASPFKNLTSLVSLPWAGALPSSSLSSSSSLSLSSASSDCSTPPSSFSAFTPSSSSSSVWVPTHDRADHAHQMRLQHMQHKEKERERKRRCSGFVPREVQLRKLYIRMQVEGAVPMTMAAASGMPCRTCDGGVVRI